MTDSKRSAAAKKAAETRKAKAEAEQEGKDSQQEPEQDSGLQTPQPDQPMPTEPERSEQDSEPEERYSGRKVGSREDHVIHGGASFRADVRVNPEYRNAVEAFRQAELAADNERHNRLTGDPSLELAGV